MPNIDSTYQAPYYLFNKHLETIIPNVFRSIKGVKYQRERLKLTDGDFLDLDWLKNQKSNKVIIISHGFEGNTKSTYILGLAKLFYQKKWDVLAWNLRSCSGTLNDLPRFYHSGSSDDLASVVNYVKNDYREVYLVGFSLGGNITLKYLGETEHKLSQNIKKAVTFSVPLHLSSSSKVLAEKKLFPYIYTQNFLRTLRKKIKAKHKVFPNHIPAKNLSKVKNLKDFDNYFTAKLHDFLDAEDYYKKCSSLYFLEKITIPTLIVNAQNDPFLAEESFPYKLVKTLKNIHFEAPKRGGHCGFSSKKRSTILWSERRVWHFFNQE